jgi:hypothetical protein
MRTHYTKPLYTTTEIREAFEMLGDMPSPLDNLAGLTAQDMHDGVPVEEIAKRNAPFFAWYPEVSLPEVEKAAQSVLAGWNGGRPPTPPSPQTEPSPVNVVAPPMVNTGTVAATFPITIFFAAALFINGDPTKFAPNTTGSSGSLTWEKFTGMFDASRIKTGAKGSRGGVSLCALRGGRRTTASFEATGLLGLDVDHHGDIDRALSARAFAPFMKVIHSTHSSTQAEPRSRIIFVTKQPCTDRSVLRRAHQALRAAAIRLDGYVETDFDNAGQDPERLFYFPTIPEGGVYRVEVTEGVPLDLDRLAPPQAPQVRPQRHTPRTCEGQGWGGAVAHAEQQMRMAEPSQRHDTSRNMAFFLARVTPEIPIEVIRSTVLAFCPSPEREREWIDLVRSALEGAGR